MSFRVLAASAAALALTACATATTGTAPQALDPQLARASHVGVVRMTSDWVMAREDFTDTFTDSVLENMRRCAVGPAALDLNIHVDHVKRKGRLATVVGGRGTHELAAVAELVDPKTRAVVGRYPIHVVVDAGNRAEALFSDRQLMVSDAFATELCRQAFQRG